MHPTHRLLTTTITSITKHTKTLTQSTQLHKPYNKPFSTKFNPAELSPHEKPLVDHLIKTFSLQNLKQISTDPECHHLGTKLTTQVVENVLNGLPNWRRAYHFFDWVKGRDGFKHNCYSYNAMASILSCARQNASMKALAENMVNERCEMRAGALGFFIRCLGSVGLVDEANSVFDRCKEMGTCYVNDYTYCCLLEVICRAGKVELAEKRLQEMVVYGGWRESKYALTPMLMVYCKAGMFDKAWDVFNQIREGGWLDAHVLSSLVISISKWGSVDRAFEMVERMEEYGVSLNEKTFFVLIHGFVSVSKVNKAVELFEKMCRLGFSPDIAVYDKLIGGLCKSKEVEKALDLYSRMRSSGISPDIGIITKLISNVSAEELMVKLVEESGLVLNSKSKAYFCHSILYGLVNNGSIDRAYQAIRTMLGKGDKLDPEGGEDKLFRFFEGVMADAACFDDVIDGLYKSGRLDEALELFGDMGRIGCERSVLLYNNLIDALSSSQRVEECLELLNEMKDSGIQPTQFTYNSIYGHYCRQGDVPGALDLLKEMRLHGHKPWIKHSTLLVQQLCKHGRAVEACDFLDQMDNEQFLPDIVPYSAALDGLIKIQEVERAFKLLDDICARGYKPDVVTYNILIKGLCKVKKVAEASNILNEMVVNGLLPSVVTCNSLIDGWCKDGDIDQALSCFSKMVGKEREPNVVTYTTLIDGLCNAERPDDAVMLWREMESKGILPNRIAFMALISGLCKNNNPDPALSYLREMEKKELTADSFIYVALVRAFLSKRNPQLAFDILREMVAKGMLSELYDKDHSLLKDAIHKLLEDPCTSSNVKTLIAEGSIPSDLLLDSTASENPLVCS